jgi:hypothetical protein
VLQPGATRAFAAASGACGVPASAEALAVNVTVTQPTALGHLTLFAGDQPPPPTSTINFAPGQTRANNAVVKVAGDGAGSFKIRATSLGTVHVIVDVVGYFE